MGAETELFPAASVAMDSPKLAWLKRHQVRVKRCAVEDEGMMDDCCGVGHRWIIKDDSPQAMDGDTCATGTTEHEACANYAIKHAIPLWNEAPKEPAP